MTFKCRQWFTFIFLLLGVSSASALELSPLQKKPYKGDFDELKNKSVIRVLVAADLGFYYIEGGRPKGIIAELLYHFEKQLKKTSPYLNLQVIPIHRDDLLPAIESGYGDLAMANLTITEKRKQRVDFSSPFISDVSELIVTQQSVTPFTSIEQLSGQEVWIRASSSYFESLQRINFQLDAIDQPPVVIQFIEETLQDYELMEMINLGHIKATVLDSHKAELWMNAMENLQVHTALPLREGGKIAWAMRKNSPQLKTVTDQFLKSSRAGTLLGNVIYNKYIEDTRWLARLLDPNKVERLASLYSIFSVYSEQYSFDPLMMSAQGFQESGLDQSKVSHKGAVGVMQVLPSTAKDPNVAIADIQKVDNNIHAGVKYMRFIQDRYFTDDDISADNQVYFTLAAYNAGPANIRKMRRLAVKHGYDPNVWFKNVEIIARRNIGKEPVTYVANINRYYVVYKQLSALKQLRAKRNASVAPTELRPLRDQ
ncbi:lytic transglycosylase F [Vibrio genomosp. F10]|uniref:transporter substrate-binding domain-containing protein n=1 Tax=Vibrio genomosp. F10 TaxID=723171 RepID=UPI0002F211D2|nr:lytic transglycosylase F [Vibrio genomosp. F10]OEE93361.1 lytic transglycosylase F [Vibrio genomosp. F10 str. 9ZC157]OEF10245.1 lytic transglycosylase F [Vibrio genomosp. F10 str. 9ZB36]